MAYVAALTSVQKNLTFPTAFVPPPTASSGVPGSPIVYVSGVSTSSYSGGTVLLPLQSTAYTGSITGSSYGNVPTGSFTNSLKSTGDGTVTFGDITDTISSMTTVQWINFSTYAGGAKQTVMSKWDDCTGSNRSWLVNMNSSGTTLEVIFCKTGGCGGADGIGAAVSLSPTLALNTWYMISLVYNGTTGYGYTYVNDTLVNTLNFSSPGDLSNTTAQLRLGRQNPEGCGDMRILTGGWYGEYVYYADTANTISSIYNATKTKYGY